MDGIEVKIPNEISPGVLIILENQIGVRITPDSIKKVRNSKWSAVWLVRSVGFEVFVKACPLRLNGEMWLGPLLEHSGFDCVAQTLATLVENEILWTVTQSAGKIALTTDEGRIPGGAIPHLMRDLAFAMINSGESIGSPMVHMSSMPDLLNKLIYKRKFSVSNSVIVSSLKRLEDDCSELNHLPIRCCFEHGDMHPGNIVVDANGKARLIDICEAVVAPPFLSLSTLVLSMPYHKGGSPELAKSCVDAHMGPFMEVFGGAVAERAKLLADEMSGIWTVLKLGRLFGISEWPDKQLDKACFFLNKYAHKKS